MAPQTQKQWTVQGTGSFDNLKLNEQAKIPELGDSEVLVKCEFDMTLSVSVFVSVSASASASSVEPMLSVVHSQGGIFELP